MYATIVPWNTHTHGGCSI